MTYSPAKLRKLLARSKQAKKGDNGKVLVIAGSKDLAGAAILSSVAALRVGADIVTLACPKNVGDSINRYCPDIMTLKLDGDHLSHRHYDRISHILDKYDVVLIGNGIGLRNETRRLVQKLAKNRIFHSKLKVIDADAIKMMRIQDVENAIFTPHRKEYETLLANSDLKSLDELGTNLILLKGQVDQIITKDKTYLNKTGNPGMAKAGTGDVLAGIVAGILAKTKNPVESAKAGAWLNGHIGDILMKRKKGYYFIASDLINEIDKILQK
jgi:ADP-dependent NAD(P)H-hydrate dehydratase / NAD(P)H-hydrate epimerase